MKPSLWHIENSFKAKTTALLILDLWLNVFFGLEGILG